MREPPAFNALRVQLPLLQGLDHDLLGDLRVTRLDHHDGFFGAGDDKVQTRLARFIVGRINDVAAIDQSDTHTGDRVHERNVGKVKRT